MLHAILTSTNTGRVTRRAEGRVGLRKHAVPDRKVPRRQALLVVWLATLAGAVGGALVGAAIVVSDLDWPARVFYGGIGGAIFGGLVGALSASMSIAAVQVARGFKPIASWKRTALASCAGFITSLFLATLILPPLSASQLAWLCLGLIVPAVMIGRTVG